MISYIFQDYKSISAGIRCLFSVNKVGKINIWLRLMFYLYGNRVKLVKLMGGLCHNHILKTYSSEISPGCKIGKGIQFPHPIGIVIGFGCELQENVVIYQNVTLGKAKNGYPCLKNNVTVYPNSSIIGPITIEENTIIGANSVVLKSTEINSVYAGCPAKKIK